MADPAQPRPSGRKARWKTVLVIALVLAALLAAALPVGYYFFAGWRARDLARKAKASFETGNYRMAWLQLKSAQDLRGNSPEVLRASSQIEAAFGRPEALGYFDKLAALGQLEPADLEARAMVAARLGTPEQFTKAVDALTAAANVTAAGNARVARQLRQGDLDRAIGQAREAAALSDDPSLKLSLAGLLRRRYDSGQPGVPPATNEGLLAAREMEHLIDALQGTPRADEALALGLTAGWSSPDVLTRWAQAALAKPRFDSLALMPGAAWLVASRQKSLPDIHAQLRPVFDSAPVGYRATYAQWLSQQGMPSESLTLVTAPEASENTSAFIARADALFRLGKMEAVLKACEDARAVEPDVRAANKARAEYELGRNGASSLEAAIEAASKTRRLEVVLPMADALGAGTLADEKLAALCAQPEVADYVFRVARDRLPRRGRLLLLESAYQNAAKADARNAAVQDYARYRKLLASEPVDAEETAAAIAQEPSYIPARITRAWVLLNEGKPADAMKVFEDVTLFADKLPPGQQAVIAAVLSANGQTQAAAHMAANIDPSFVHKAEFALAASARAEAVNLERSPEPSPAPRH